MSTIRSGSSEHGLLNGCAVTRRGVLRSPSMIRTVLPAAKWGLRSRQVRCLRLVSPLHFADFNRFYSPFAEFFLDILQQRL